MKLIIEKEAGSVYAYMEREKHHKKAEKLRTTPLIKPKVLNDNCDIGDYPDFHMIFDIKK